MRSKKITSFISIFCVLLSSCSSSSSNTTINNRPTIDIQSTTTTTEEVSQVYKAGETVSNDVVDFTFIDAELAYYVKWDKETHDPQKVDSGGENIVAAPKGSVLVLMTVAITNKDRVDLDFMSNSGNLTSDVYTHSTKYKTILQYNGNDSILSISSNNNVAYMSSPTLDFSDSYICHGVSNLLGTAYKALVISPNDTVYVKLLGEAEVDPASLDDNFIIKFCIPTSEKDILYERISFAF